MLEIFPSGAFVPAETGKWGPAVGNHHKGWEILHPRRGFFSEKWSENEKKRSQILKNSESDSTFLLLFRLDQGVTGMEQASCFATQKSPRTPIKPKKKVADSKIDH